MDSLVGSPVKTDSVRLADLASRLKAAVQHAGGNKVVARKSGVPLSTLNTYLAGTADPKITVLEKIVAACRISVGQLLSEVGDPENCIGTHGLVVVPALKVAAAAGSGRIAAPADLDDDSIAFPEPLLRRIALSPRHAQALVAVGDSMEPTICDGDLLVIDRSDIHITHKRVFVLVRDGLVLVKRAYVRGEGVVLRSDNTEMHDEQYLPAGELNQLRIEGRVRLIVRTM